MRIFNSRLMGIVSISLLISFFSCNDDLIQEQCEPEQEAVELRGTYNTGFFDWDRIDEITYYNHQDVLCRLPLPWAPGSASNSGIPKEWLDSKSHLANFQERYYSREKGWVLTYSNIHMRSETSKYFSLYNTKTGILRTFLITPASSSGPGTSAVSLAMCLNQPSSLFNFMDTYATGINAKKSLPGYIHSPIWTFGSSSSSIGYKENTWYGIELECAYDPDLAPGSFFSFGLSAITNSNTIGKGLTSGSIQGSIKSTTPNMTSLSFDLSTKNTVNKSTSVDLNDISNVAEMIGDKIDKEKRSNSFYAGLVNSLSQKLGTSLANGAKDGLRSLIQNGGSAAVAKALGSTIHSLIGTNEQVFKVSLALKDTTQYELTTITNHLGWGIVNNIPLPGSAAGDPPLYDQPLGVWNLDKTPTVDIDFHIAIMSETSEGRAIETTSWMIYSLKSGNVILNPSIKNEYTIKNIKYQFAVSEWTINNLLYWQKPNVIGHPDYEIIYHDNYTYHMISSNYYTGYFYNIYASGGSSEWHTAISSTPKLCRISFELEHKQTGETIYFSKYFNVNVGTCMTYFYDSQGRLTGTRPYNGN